MSDKEIHIDSDNSDRLDLRAKEYARKVRRRREEARAAADLRAAASLVESATIHFREFLDAGGEDDDMTLFALDEARRSVDDALGGFREDR